jgi:two-component system sensor histidine kinase BaeS
MGAASRRLGDPDRAGPGRGSRSGPRPSGWTGDPDRREGGPGSRGDGVGRGGEGFGRGDRGFRAGRGGGPAPLAIEFASIVVDNVPAGLVAVPAAPPPLWVTVRDVGPTLAIAAAVLLIAGTAIAALVVIRPADRRLRGLQRAAAALGAGQAGARAPDAGGDEIASLAHTFNDMAARLEERAGALERADATRRQLLADVSHELMTPLAAIRGYVETLAMSNVSLDDATRGRYLGIVTEEAERLEQIIGDLLDLARLEGGGGEIKRQPVTVAALCERVRRRHGAALQARGIALETQLEGDLTVEGDASRLEQALQNLVANAARHTPAGGRVALGASRQGDDIALTVDDTGPGVPADHLPHIFNRFYKADVSRAGTTVPSGSGLGLSIVQAIVSRHGGRVTAANRAEGGARFEIRLPAPPSAPRQSPA